MKFRISSILDIMLGIIICSYVGPFASYSGVNLLIFITLIFFCLMLSSRFATVEKRKLGMSWKLLISYFFLNSLFNMPKSLWYLMLIVFGVLILKRKISEDSIEIVKHILRVVTVMLSISIMVQVFAPSLFYGFARKWFFYSNQYDLVFQSGSISHQYSGLMYEVSYSAVILSIGICIFFSDFLTRENRKIINAIFIIMAYIAIYFTGKRSFILIIPLSLVIYWFIYNAKRLTYKHFILIIVAVIVLFLSSEEILKIVVNILGKGQTGIQLSSRERYWQIALTMFRDNPIFGQGLNSFDVWFNQSGIKSYYFNFAGAHNSYLQMLAEVGIIGFGLYFYCFIQIIYEGLKKLSLSAKVKNSYASSNLLFSLCSMTCILIYGLSGNPLYQPQQVITLFFLMSIVRTTKVTVLKSN